ncbi:MAG: hypothetical protein EOP68_15390, partial [Sphingomonas sp.]
MSEGIAAMWKRGGTSKGGFFVADELPTDIAARDAFLLRAAISVGSSSATKNPPFDVPPR